ncbi:MAG: sigma-70 family RNA polymerase sigma factor [Anaerolineae bacterium]|nr:sigma-70 family RNA polymerase sigma factor [Anaerolineae bacterium]
MKQEDVLQEMNEKEELWNEEALVKAAQKGDLDAFNALILRYQSRAYHLACSFLRDGAAAEDAVQEAFISAFGALKRFQAGSFRAWLLRIVVNACYDELRRHKRRPIVSWDDNEDMEPESSPFLKDVSALPEDIAQQNELAALLDRALSTLSKEQRLVMVLVDRLGFSYEEVAQTTHQPLGTVKSRLARARERMREWLLREKIIVERFVASPDADSSSAKAQQSEVYVSLG